MTSIVSTAACCLHKSESKVASNPKKQTRRKLDLFTVFLFNSRLLETINMSDKDSDEDLFGFSGGEDDDTDDLMNASAGKAIAKKKSTPKKKSVKKSIPGKLFSWVL